MWSSTPASCLPRGRGRSPRTRSRRERRSCSPRCGATSTSASTPPTFVLQPPDRSELKEIFRRFEFRALLGRIDTLDEALPAAERPQPATSEKVPWREGDLKGLRGRVGVSADAERVSVATAAGEVIVAIGGLGAAAREELEVVAHDAKELRLGEPAADDTMIAAYLVDPGRAEYELDDLMAEYGVELEPDPPAEEETAALVRHAEAAAPPRGTARRKGHRARLGAGSIARSSSRSPSSSRRWRTRASHRHLSHGRDHGSLSDRIEELESRAYDLAGEEFVLGSPQQLGRDPLREARADARPQGQDRLLDRRQGASRDPRRPRDRPGGRGVARAHEARQHLPRPAADADRRRRAPAHDDQPDRRRNRAPLDVEPQPAGDPDPHGARPRDPLGVRRRSPGTGCSPPTTRRSSCGSSRTSPGEPKLREAFERGEDIHTATAAEVLGKDPATLTKDERNVAKMINFGIVYGISAFGLSENLDIPKEQAQAYIDAYLARFPHVQAFIARTIAQAGEDGYATSLLGRRRPVPELRALEPADARLRRAASRSTSSCRARTRTSSRSRWSRSTRGCGGGERRAARSAGARRAPARGPGDRGLEGARARPRGDGRRISARSHAGGRHRRRRRLGRSEVLATDSSVSPSAGTRTAGSAARSSARARKQWFSASRWTATTVGTCAATSRTSSMPMTMRPPSRNSAPPAFTTATRGRWRAIVSSTPSYQTVSPAM